MWYYIITIWIFSSVQLAWISCFIRLMCVSWYFFQSIEWLLQIYKSSGLDARNLMGSAIFGWKIDEHFSKQHEILHFQRNVSVFYGRRYRKEKSSCIVVTFPRSINLWICEMQQKSPKNGRNSAIYNKKWISQSFFIMVKLINRNVKWDRLNTIQIRKKCNVAQCK